VFGPQGPLARVIPGYAYRPEQSAMAAAVGRALALDEALIVEAGTGTGKTFAYLVPALLSGRSVIISTGTRTLQDQLFRRDVPTLARALGGPVKMALLKGRANYLCRHRLELTLQQRSLFKPARATARLLARVSRWAAVTKTGDLAELTDLPEQSPVWPTITSTRENCPGQECAQFARCHVVEARRAAQAADIVVVNHHLLLADLALKDEGFGDLLPGADAVILDEAHQIPDIAAQFFGQSWAVRAVQYLLKDIAAEIEAAAVRAPAVIDLLATLSGCSMRCATASEAARGAMSGSVCRTHSWRRCRRSRPLCTRSATSSRASVRARAPPTAVDGRERLAAQLSQLSNTPAGGRHPLGRCQRIGAHAAIHAVRDRRAFAPIHRGASERLGVHLRDPGDRR
jgi:Rad3-related DNA helicase